MHYIRAAISQKSLVLDVTQARNASAHIEQYSLARFSIILPPLVQSNIERFRFFVQHGQRSPIRKVTRPRNATIKRNTRCGWTNSSLLQA